MSTPGLARARRDINFVFLKDGSSVHLDDIATVEQGQAVLDDLDCAIVTIRAQIEAGEAESRPWHWRKSAKLALNKKQSIRPRLQQRIAELRRAERQEAHRRTIADGVVKPPGKKSTRVKAFVAAAHELLPAETVVEIWARAAEREPEAFADTGVSA